MNFKKLLKILGTITLVFLLILICVSVYIFAKLPSPNEIAKTIYKAPAGLSAHPKPADKMRNAETRDANTDQASKEPSVIIQTSEEKAEDDEQLKERVVRLIFDDFTNEQRPYVEVCNQLTQARQSQYIKDEHSHATALYFMSSLASENADERDLAIETAAPIIRYAFRAPGMSEVLRIAQQSKESSNSSETLRKAELYSHVYQMAKFLYNHTSEMNAIVQKSYNLNMLVRAVSLKPELAKDLSTLNFCLQIEDSLNSSGSFNVEEQAQEIQKFLNVNGIDPQAIGFDPEYRAQVATRASKHSVKVNDGWIESFFARDIEDYKAKKKFKDAN